MRNDGDDEAETQLVTGKAEKMDGDDKDVTYVAVLWVPDPTERRGWRDMWIERKPESKPKAMGFGKQR